MVTAAGPSEVARPRSTVVRIPPSETSFSVGVVPPVGTDPRVAATSVGDGS